MLHTLAALNTFLDIPVSTREEARESRPHPEEPFSSSEPNRRDPFPGCSERIPGVPVTSQEGALSTGKARGTPGSCHHSSSPPDVSVHSREACFPGTASTFKPRIDSHHGGTWDITVGKPRGKAWWESVVGKRRGKASWESLVGKPQGKAPYPLNLSKGSVTLLLQLGRKAHVNSPTREDD